MNAKYGQFYSRGYEFGKDNSSMKLLFISWLWQSYAFSAINARQSDTMNQTSIEIHALIEFIEAYEKDNAENLKKEKEIEERFLHKKD